MIESHHATGSPATRRRSAGPQFPVAALSGRPAPIPRRGRAARTLGPCLLAGLLLVPVVAVRLGWSNPTATEAEYRHLAAGARWAERSALGPAGGVTLYDRLVAPAAAGGEPIRGLGAPAGAPPRPAAAAEAPTLRSGRALSGGFGLLGVVAAAWWLHRVVATGRVGRGWSLVSGATPPPHDPPRGRVAPAAAAALAVLALGLCLPLVQHAAMLGPATPALALLLLGGGAAWHAVAGAPGRRAPRCAAVLAVVCGAAAWALSPRVAPAVVAAAAWAAAAAALRIRGEPDPHRRFRRVTSAALGALLVLSLLVGVHFAAPGASGRGLLPEFAAEPPAAVRWRWAGELLAERLGWLAWASPLALAAAAWVRPAAGSLLVLVAAASLAATGVLASPEESDLLPAVAAVLLAWGLAVAAVLPRVAAAAAACFQALTERLGVFRHAAAVGRVAAAGALGLLLCWGAYRSPGFYLTAAVLHQGPHRGPYGRTDWARAEADLQRVMARGDAVATSAPAAARFHLGRADVLLSRERLAAAVAGADGPGADGPGADGPGADAAGVPREGADGGFAVPDPASGLPVVASVEGVRSLFRERPRGLVVVDRAHWRTPQGVPAPVAEEIERRAVRVPLSRRAGLLAFRWTTREPPTASGSVGEAGVLGESLGPDQPMGTPWPPPSPPPREPPPEPPPEPLPSPLADAPPAEP